MLAEFYISVKCFEVFKSLAELVCEVGDSFALSKGDSLVDVIDLFKIGTAFWLVHLFELIKSLVKCFNLLVLQELAGVVTKPVLKDT